MTRSEAELITKAGEAKAALSRTAPLRYVIRAALAGCFIFLGALASCLTSAWLYADHIAAAKLLGAFTFSIALILIVLLGGELFTGCNFVMGFSLYDGKVTPAALLRVWLLCYVGNYIGILVLSLLFAGSGASRDMAAAYLTILVSGKLSVPWYQQLLRGVLCNFCVCVGVYAGFKLKSEAGKIIVIACAIFTFVLAGFEHSIANMAYFTLYALLVPGASASAPAIAANMVFVTMGNLLGGAVLLALPLWGLSDRK